MIRDAFFNRLHLATINWLQILGSRIPRHLKLIGMQRWVLGVLVTRRAQSAGERVETAALPAAVWVAVDVCCACQCGLNKDAGQELSL